MNNKRTATLKGYSELVYNVIHVLYTVDMVQVETEVFDKMDIFVSRGEGDEAYRDLFNEM